MWGPLGVFDQQDQQGAAEVRAVTIIFTAGHMHILADGRLPASTRVERRVLSREHHAAILVDVYATAIIHTTTQQ